MEEGEYYYTESTLLNGGGYININIGMEIEPDVCPETHPNFERQVQQVSIGQTGVLFDTMTVTITDSDDQTFRLRYQIPGTSDLYQSEIIVAGGDANQFKDAIKEYYDDRFDFDPEVTRTYLDATGVETSEVTTTVKYTIVVPVAIPADQSPSVEGIIVEKVDTEATFEIAYPAAVQLSDAPLEGEFVAYCYHPDGQFYATRPMDTATVNANTLRVRLETDCGFLKGKIEVV